MSETRGERAVLFIKATKQRPISTFKHIYYLYAFEVFAPDLRAQKDISERISHANKIQVCECDVY